MTYIEKTFDNYYNIPLEDRLKLIDRIYKLHEENECEFDFTYNDAIKTIRLTTKKMIQASKFEEFYNNLDKKEKKEFQTQVYLMADSGKKMIAHRLPNKYKIISKIYGIQKDESDIKEEFSVDFNKLDKEFKNCYYNDVDIEKIISNFCMRYYTFAFDQCYWPNLSKEEYKEYLKKYSNPLVFEFNKIMNKCISVILSEARESAKDNFCSLLPEQQLYITFSLLNITKQELNTTVLYRQEFKNMDEKSFFGNKEKLNDQIK